jgi:hypothetical protein
MQAQSTQDTSVFQPLTLTIVLETEAEVKALTTMTNYTPIVDAVKAAGLNLEPIFNMMPKGVYNPQTWDEDVKTMANVLSNHTALDYKQDTIDVEDQLDKMVEDFLGSTTTEETPATQTKAPTNPITCKAIAEDYSGGTIEVSDGRQYQYELTGCGEAIVIKTMDGTLVTEVPTSVYGTEELKAADIEVLETVFAQIN